MYTAERTPTAVVTGAGSGIGGAIADRLAGLGYSVVVFEHDPDAARSAVERLSTPTGPTPIAWVADVAEPESWRALRARLRDEGAALSLLVGAAGVLVAGRLADCSAEDLGRLVEVNLLGVMHGCRELTPMLAESPEAAPLPRGVLNVASVFATVCPPGFAAYNASKAGVVALTETLAGELRPRGLAATVVLPGVTPTGLFDRAAYADEGLRRLIRERVADAELTADGVAEAALDAYRHGRVTAVIGRRASRYAWLRRLAPGAVLRRVADQTLRAWESQT